MPASVNITQRTGTDFSNPLPARPVYSGSDSSHHLGKFAPTPEAGLDFDWVQTRCDFNALQDEWNALFARSGQGSQVFQTFGWCWHWCNAFLPANSNETEDCELAVLTARKQGQLVLVFPLVRKKSAGLVELKWLGDPVTQYGDVLVDAENTNEKLKLLQAAWDVVLQESQADLVFLRKVRADSAFGELIAKNATAPTRTVTAPYMDLASAPDFDAYVKRYSSRARRNRRRLRRRLEERGEITVRNIATGQEAKELAIEAIRLKRQWLVSRGLASPALADPRTQTFFANVAKGGPHDTGCAINAVFCDAKPVAIEVSFQCKGSNALHITVFDLDFEKVGVGAFLLENNLRQAFDNGLARYDFLAPSDRYKLEWCDDTVDVHDWAVGLSLKGKLVARIYHGFLRERLKAVWEHMPVNFRQRLKKLPKFAL